LVIITRCIKKAGRDLAYSPGDEKSALLARTLAAGRFRCFILILIESMSFAQHLFSPGFASFRSRVPPVRLTSLSFAGTKNLLCWMPCFRIELECVSKFARQHFRHLFLHSCVFKPRFTASKPSVFILELQENLLETAPVSF